MNRWVVKDEFGRRAGCRQPPWDRRMDLSVPTADGRRVGFGVEEDLDGVMTRTKEFDRSLVCGPGIGERSTRGAP